MDSDQGLQKDARKLLDDLQAIRRLLQRPIAAEISGSGLTGPQLGVLDVLVGVDGLSLKELSQRVGLSHSTVSGIVDRLEQRGLVQRRPLATDRRFTQIGVSSEVQDYIRDMVSGQRTAPLEAALKQASSGDRLQIIASIHILRDLLEQIVA